MIEELEGTVAETLYRLRVETLDPRDEALFCERFWEKDTGPVWELRGRFPASGVGTAWNTTHFPSWLKYASPAL